MKMDRRIAFLLRQDQNFDLDLDMDYSCSRDEMETGYFLFVFNRRLNAGMAKGIVAKGLKELVENPVIQLYDTIVSHYYENGTNKFIVYTDINCTVLFGVVSW